MATDIKELKAQKLELELQIQQLRAEIQELQLKRQVKDLQKTNTLLRAALDKLRKMSEARTKQNE